MSGLLDESARVTATYAAPTIPHALPRTEKPAPERLQEGVVEITLSPEAQATLASINADREKTTERAERAVQGAKEVAATAGVSEAEAVAAAQPLRSPPPAKGVVMFQANMGAAQSTDAAPK